MIVINTLADFSSRIGILVGDDFDDLPIKPDLPLGIFFTDRLEELKRFCAENPRYHILTQVKHSIYNQVIIGGPFYSIGQGDANPRLIYLFGQTPQSVLEDKLSEFDRD